MNGFLNNLWQEVLVQAITGWLSWPVLKKMFSQGFQNIDIYSCHFISFVFGEMVVAFLLLDRFFKWSDKVKSRFLTIRGSQKIFWSKDASEHYIGKNKSLVCTRWTSTNQNGSIYFYKSNPAIDKFAVLSEIATFKDIDIRQIQFLPPETYSEHISVGQILVLKMKDTRLMAIKILDVKYSKNNSHKNELEVEYLIQKSASKHFF